MISRKIGIWAFLTLFLVTLTFGFYNPPTASAEVVVRQPSDVQSASFRFVDRSQIQVTFPGSPPITYIDGELDNSLDYAANPAAFCKTGNVLNDAQQIINGFNNAQVPIGGGGAARVDATIAINVMVIPAGSIAGECQRVSLRIQIDNTNNLGSVLLEGSEGGVSFVFDGSSYQSVSPDGLVLGKAPGASTCFGGSVVLLNASKTSGTLYTLSTANFGGSLASSDPGIGRYFAGSNCRIYSKMVSAINGTVGVGTPTTCTEGEPGCECTGAGATQVCTLAGVDDDPTCESTYSRGLEWLLCGLISQIDDIAKLLNGIIEEQLDFNIDQNLTDDVQKVWSTMRILATSLLLIVALAMVISQAISWGPFDAYTVRKLLPRLIVAIILMQLSWEMGKFLIMLANDAGSGIADIMYAPFGGASQISLENELARLGWGTGLTLLGGLAIGSIVGLVALGPFGIILAAFSILISLIVGLLVLLFRKILIIFCMILAPLALVAWILPGTQKYFNLWWETFTKLLLMFPLIIALIAAGRIFGSVAATGAGDAGILDLMAVLIGFFGVYFIIPKTFQWGGRALGNLAGTINNQKGMFEKPKKVLQDRQGQYKAAQAAKAAHRRDTDGYDGRLGVGKFSVGTGSFGRRVQRGVDKGRLGEYDPTRLVARNTMKEMRREQELKQSQAGVAYGMRDEIYKAKTSSLEGAEKKQLMEYAKLKFEGVSLQTDEGKELFRASMDSKRTGPGGEVDNEYETAAAVGAAFAQRAVSLFTDSDKTKLKDAFNVDPKLYGESQQLLRYQPQNLGLSSTQLLASFSEKQLGEQHKSFYEEGASPASIKEIAEVATRVSSGTDSGDDSKLLQSIRNNISNLANNSTVNATITPEIVTHINTVLAATEAGGGAPTTYESLKGGPAPGP